MKITVEPYEFGTILKTSENANTEVGKQMRQV